MKDIKQKYTLKIKRFENYLITRYRKHQIRRAYQEKSSISLVILVVAVAFIGGGFASYLISTSQDNLSFDEDRGSIVGDFYNEPPYVEDSSTIICADTVDIVEDEDYFDYGYFLRSIALYKPVEAVDGQEELTRILLADKSDRIIHLLVRVDGFWVPARTFPITSGSRPGDKQYEGDRRTPEGIYFIVGHKDGDRLHDIYGPMAYILNYPNRHDLAEGKTGHGIWIHGTFPGAEPVDTRGCLGLHNDNLVKLSELIGEGDMVPVLIHDKGGASFSEVLDLHAIWYERQYILSKREAQIERDSIKGYLKEYVERWAEAWSSMDEDRYFGYYDSIVFPSWDAWVAQKRRTFGLYSEINVSVSSVSVVSKTDSSAILRFMQAYRSDRFQSRGNKQLDLRLVDDVWRIVNEQSLP